jgi:Fe-S cluster assembly ATP-binding protein
LKESLTVLEIRNLHAVIDGKEILNGLDLSIKAGEVHAIMGPNGSGKSTLAKVLAGHPSYEVTEGEVIYEGRNLPTTKRRNTKGAMSSTRWNSTT